MKLYIIAGIALVLVAMAVWESKRELKRFRITQYTIQARELTGLKSVRRVVFLSDLHNYSYGKENQELLNAIISQAPDLILIGGDMLIRKDGHSYEGTLQFLRKLSSICPVYYANGNHEQRLKEWADQYEQSYEDYRNELLKSGIQMLENDSAVLRWDDAEICITGLEIPMEGYERLKRVRIPIEKINDRIGNPGEAYQILLAHNPKYIPLYQEWGANLILSGHLHGGIVRLPMIGGVIGPDFFLFPRYSGGIYHISEQCTAVVSKGLGAHSIPIRLFNPAEMVVLEFKP